MERNKVKLSLFADDIILYREKPKESTKKLLELINKFSEVAGYKINFQKLAACLYTNNQVAERETEKTIPFTTALTIISYIGINLTKDVKDLYSKICKTLKKETEEETNKWKHMLCL